MQTKGKTMFNGQPQKFVLIMSSVFFFASACFATDDGLSSLHYPELEVTPLASDRLKSEAVIEHKGSWATHWTIQSAGLGALLAGITGNGSPKDDSVTAKNDNSNASKIAIGVGGAWIATSIALQLWYAPYKSGYYSVKKMNDKGKKDLLARERAAEEALYAPSRLMTKLKWLSFISTFGASLYMVDNVDEDNKLIPALGAIASLAPVLFNHRWIETAETHKKYKKKIYGPIAGMAVFKGESGTTIPGIAFSMSF